jgi:hypothetical protein
MRSLLRRSLAPLVVVGSLVAGASGEPVPAHCCAVLELRQYTLKPGQRDVLIGLFERHFVEPQEALGMRIPGTFRDAGRADRLVWLRGFGDMESRRTALAAFYGGPVWKEHRTAANATMIDSDDVLLLRPASGTAGLDLTGTRPALDEPERPARTMVATIHSFAGPVDAGFVEWFGADVVPLITKAGATVLGQFVTEPSPNTFPALPVREGENVFVWFAAYRDATAATLPLDNVPGWTGRVVPKLRLQTKGQPERIVLEPTRRSLLR